MCAFSMPENSGGGKKNSAMAPGNFLTLKKNDGIICKMSLIFKRSSLMKLQFLTRFRDILWFSAKRYTVDNHSQRAVALTYYTVFAIVPMAALLFGIAKGFDLDVRLKEELSRQLYQHKEILEWVCKFADTTLKQAQGGIVAGVGIIALIWTVLWLASNIERAFNDVWGLPTRKNIFRRFSDYLAQILLTPLMLVIVGASGVALRSVFNKLAEAAPDLGSTLPCVFSLAADLSPLVISIAVFTLIYLFAPNTRVRFCCALLAGIIGGVLFQLLQDGFLFLQSNIFKYNRIYGTFAVLPLFLVWLQWSWQIALFGAEIGYVSQNLDTGIFDGKGDSIENLLLRRADQISCAAMIYSSFAQNEGSVSFATLTKEINLPGTLLASQLHELCQKRIIYALNNEGNISYAPGFPTDSFTAGDCLAKLNGNDELPATQIEILNRTLTLLKGFEEKNRHSETDPLLKDL